MTVPFVLPARLPKRRGQMVLESFSADSGASIPREWSVGLGTWNIVGAQLVQTNASASWKRMWFPGLSVGNARITARIKAPTVDGVSILAKVALRHDGAGGHVGYAFGLGGGSTGKASLETWGLAYLSTVNYAWTPSEWYEITLEAINQRLRGFINGRRVVDVTNTTYTSGVPGLGYYATAGALEWVVIEAL